MFSANQNSDLRVTSQKDLSPYLQVDVPEKNLVNAPPVFVFKRKREIDIPWAEIWLGLKNQADSNPYAIRKYFEQSWGYDSGNESTRVDNDALAELLSGDAPHILVQRPPEPESDNPADPTAEGGELAPEPEPAPEPIPEPPEPAPDPLTFYLSVAKAGAEAEVLEVTNGVFCRHGLSGRWYLLLTAEGDGGVLPDFTDQSQYESYWQDQVIGISVVYLTADDAKAMRTTVQEIDLRAPYIERKYTELQLQLDSAKEKAAQYDVLLKSTPAQDLEAIEAGSNALCGLKFDVVSLERKQQLLVVQAGDLGYKLFFKKPESKADYPENFPEDLIKENKVIPGRLYKVGSESIDWTVQVPKPYFKVKKAVGIAALAVVSGGLALVAGAVGWVKGGYKGTKMVDKSEYGQKIVYEPVEPRQDLVEKKRRELEAKGKEVYILEEGVNGFITGTGFTLKNIMARCDADEPFRKRCILFLPVYETSITGDVATTHYTIIENPLPGIVPTMLPRLSFFESLSFRSAWQGAELGELAAGVNLAPGERREVTISKEIRRETTEKRSSTSVFDLNRSDTQDFASEMEDQVRREKDISTNAEASVKGSGDILGFSTKASAKAGVETSIKDFSNAIVKTAKKAAQSLNSKSHQEVSTSSEMKASVTQTDITKATLENINQGRTLNLFFYRLYNSYKTGLYIDDLSLDVVSGVEVIAGSGIYESRRFGLHDLGGMLEALDFSNLPFGLAEADRYLYCHHVIDVFYELLVRDYVDEREQPSGNQDTSPNKALINGELTNGGLNEDGPELFSGPLTLDQNAKIKSHLPKLTTEGFIDDKATPKRKNTAEGIDSRIKGLSNWLSNKGLKSAPMIESKISVLSDALYLDSMVGSQPATEPYSEQMRAQEVKLKEAEIYERYSEGVYKQAQASRLTGMAPDGGLNAITGYLPDPVSKSLTVSLRRPLGPGDWALCLNGDPIANVDERWAMHQVISVPFDQENAMLGDDITLKTVELRNSESGQVVSLSC